MSSIHKGLVRELAPLLARELLRELKSQRLAFLESLEDSNKGQNHTKHAERSTEEIEQWAAKEAKRILAEMRRTKKPRNTLEESITEK